MNTTPPAISAGRGAAQQAILMPAPLAGMTAGRVERPGDIFGLRNFGVNRCTPAPESISALPRRHTAQNEFIYLPEGAAVLVTDEVKIAPAAGMRAGFAAGDAAPFPPDDLAAAFDNGGWRFTRAGTPYRTAAG